MDCAVALHRPMSSPSSSESSETNSSNPSTLLLLEDQIRQANNQIGTVILYGVPIVSLMMDNKERLCLAQISSTLLKDYSYNEIHNRRVALGITCAQCTPVQLELLRRAGAMPVTSRRCGMITRREAERLCKSFLGDHSPPKLPENFAFDVSHSCAWGCRGAFLPSRYNSSRAKCIKCLYCSLFFSPNKFIFHSHRTSSDAEYIQPDAANFNSWRRHINLTGTPPDQVLFAWEDVKAMFNGGSRKRTGKPSDAELGQQVVTDDPVAKVSVKTNKSSAKKMKMQQQQQQINDPEGQITAAASTSASLPPPPPLPTSTASCPVVVAPAVSIPHPSYCQPSLLLAKLNSLNSGIIKSSIDSLSSTSSTGIDNHYAWSPPQLSGRLAASSTWPAGYFMPPFMHSAYSYYSYLMSNQLQQQQQQLQPINSIVKLSGGGGGGVGGGVGGSEDDEPFVDVESP